MHEWAFFRLHFGFHPIFELCWMQNNFFQSFSVSSLNIFSDNYCWWLRNLFLNRCKSLFQRMFRTAGAQKSKRSGTFSSNWCEGSCGTGAEPRWGEKKRSPVPWGGTAVLLVQENLFPMKSNEIMMEENLSIPWPYRERAFRSNTILPENLGFFLNNLAKYVHI